MMMCRRFGADSRYQSELRHPQFVMLGSDAHPADDGKSLLALVCAGVERGL